jgi:hypothetical protein
MESAKRTQLQTALLNVIQKCKNLIADISPDEAEDLEVYKELTGLVCISCEMLQTSDLLSRPGQDEDLVILTQLLFHFIKDSIKKVSSTRVKVSSLYVIQGQEERLVQKSVTF